MAKILITGVTGFVGKSLIPALLAAGHQVRCAVTHKVDELKAEQILVERLECQKDWSEALSGIEIVIHLAARVHIMKEHSKSVLEDYCKVNSTATKNLAEQAAQHQVKRFIFLSSIKVNGELTATGQPFTEHSPPKPQDPYGVSKLLAEQSLAEINQRSSMETVILRTPLIYGAGVKANFLKMMTLVNKGLPLPFGKVDNRRSFIYIDNLISAILAVLESPAAANQLYLLADNSSLSLADLMKLMDQEMDNKLRLIPVPVSLLNILLKIFRLKNLHMRLLGSLEVNNTKIKTQLQWEPPVSTKEGLARTVAWYKKGLKL